jgi:predicted  nucleic acid-binding Zn-ribbon protein
LFDTRAPAGKDGPLPAPELIMPTKREMQREIDRLRKQLKENEDLMRKAAAKAEEMMALQDQYEALQAELLQLKRPRKK